MCVSVCVLELKQILDSLGFLLGYITIRIPKVFGYKTNNFGVVILAYLGNIYIFKAILVTQ